ncbi:MAG: endonuclease/exonuclease/phosphatase family protein [Bacteroidales bacterium]
MMKKLKIISLISFLLLCFSAPALVAQDQLKILQYNVLEGFKNDSLIQDEYISWVENIDPDIIAYQEMNDFTQRKLEAFALRYGHEYAVLSKTEGYPVALSSKFPIVNVQKVIDNMWHAYIYAQIADVHIFVIHFSPHQVIKRRAEIRQILAHAALLPQDEKIVITGDFNSYAPLDSLVYDGDRLKAYREIQKKHKHIRNLDNGQFDYSVIGSIEKAGYTDLQKSYSKEFYQTLVASRQRIDYTFANESLAKHLTSMEVIVDSKTKKLSDHFPSLAIFNFSGFSEFPVTR